MYSKPILRNSDLGCCFIFSIVFFVKFFFSKILSNPELIFCFNNSFAFIVDKDIANTFIVFSKEDIYLFSSFSNMKSLFTKNIEVTIELLTFLSMISGIIS